jgi:hypothetical protein
MKIDLHENLDNLVIYPDEPLLYLLTEDIDIKTLTRLHKAPIYGAVVPHIIANNKLYESALLQIRFDSSELVKFHLIDMESLPTLSFEEKSTLLMFSDSLSQYFEPFINDMNQYVSSQIVFGSGIGTKQFDLKANIFDNSSMYINHSLIVEIKNPIEIGIKHGWEPLYGPFVVTKIKDNIIYELNHEPAFDVYAQILSELDAKNITKENFFDIAQSYPFGILTYTQNEFIVRDPICVVEESALLMVSSIEKNETIYIMKGDYNGLINAARENARATLNSSSNTSLIFDCISRVLYMKDSFTKEIEEISNVVFQNKLIYGITSIGEITNNECDTIKIFNKTNIIGAISDVEN